MPQFEVKLFQTARINTQTFTVDANSEEEAREKVEAEHLADTDLKKNGEQYDLAVEMVGTFIPEGPEPLDSGTPEGEVVDDGSSSGFAVPVQAPAQEAPAEQPAEQAAPTQIPVTAEE